MVDAIMCGGTPTDADRAVVEQFAAALREFEPKGLRGPAVHGVIYDEAAEFVDGGPMTCDRCSTTEDVAVSEACRVCGPVPLCRGCVELHHAELREAELENEDNPAIVRGDN